MKEYLVGHIDDIPEGKGRSFKAGERTIAVFRSKGEFFAIANRCLHKGASMCEGDLVDGGRTVRCPWHNWPFDLATGQNVLDPGERLRTYKVKLEGDQVIVCV